MNECQVWWTITGNFGNMMPIDWSKSTTRAKQLETLNLCDPRTKHPAGRGSSKLLPGKGGAGQSSGSGDELEDEDDLVAADLDMHSLILSSNPQEHAVRIIICSKVQNVILERQEIALFLVSFNGNVVKHALLCTV